MNRITVVQLYNIVARLNNIFGRRPSPASQPIPGTFVLQGAYGGYQLQRVVEGGGVMAITSGYRSKREVYEYAEAMLEGAAMMERHKVEKAQETPRTCTVCGVGEITRQGWCDDCGCVETGPEPDFDAYSDGMGDFEPDADGEMPYGDEVEFTHPDFSE